VLSIDAIIGRGSFGTVYVGRMQSPDGLVRRVAVKVLSDRMSADQRAVGRFRDEARLLALIDHPGLVPVYALERVEDRWAVVMGYVDGFEMAKALDKGPLPPEAVREVGIQVAEVLAAMWGHLHPQTGEPLHVVHRDIKPHNLMVDGQGRVRVLDLGVASARFEARESATLAGEVAGTLAYMSPQRWARRDDGHKGDIYALGAALYHLSTGRLVQEAGPSPSEHTQRLSEAEPFIPAPLFALICQAMSFDDEQRPTAQELARALRNIGPQGGEDLRTWSLSSMSQMRPSASDLPTDTLIDSVLGQHDIGSDSLVATAHRFQAAPEVATTDWHLSHAATLLPEDQGNAPHTPRRPYWRMLGAGVAITMGALVGWLAVPTGPTGPPVTVALAPTVEASIILNEYVALKSYLEEQLDRPIHFVVGDTYEQTAELLGSGEVDFAQLPHGMGTHAIERWPGTAWIAHKIVDGSGSVDGYLVVQRDDDIQSVEELRGHKVCFSDEGSNTGYRLPRAHLRTAGIDPDTDIQTVLAGDHGAVLTGVVEGQCRAGGTFNRNLITGDQRGIPVARLRVLAITGTIPHDGWLAGPQTDPDLTAHLGQALTDLDPPTHVGLEVIGEAERISGFSPPSQR